jgi:hypothetical protein
LYVRFSIQQLAIAFTINAGRELKLIALLQIKRNSETSSG